MEKKKILPYESLLIGIISGTIDSFVQMPLLTYKFSKQNGIKLPNNIRGWYRGALIQTYNVAPITAFQMFTNNILTKTIIKEEEIKNKDKILIASLSGGISSLLYSPIDLITIQQQIYKKNIKKTIYKIRNNYNYNIFFKGLFPCIVRESIYTGGYLGLAPITSEYINKKLEIDLFYSTLLGSFLSGTVCSLITHPFDTAKTLIQTNLSEKTNTLKILKLKIKERGLSYIYKGYVPRLIKTCNAFLICIYVERYYKDIIKYN